LQTHYIPIRVIVDQAYIDKVSRYENAQVAETRAREIVNTASIIVFEPQLNIVLTVVEFLVDTKAVCSENIGDHLTGSGDPKNPDTQHSVFVTGCDSSPANRASGVAYVDTLCAPEFARSVVRYTSTSWRTFAHEFGHAIGLQHTFQNGVGHTGGLMDYGNGRLFQILPNKPYGFNAEFSGDVMCERLNAAKTNCGFPKALKQAPQRCS